MLAATPVWMQHPFSNNRVFSSNASLAATQGHQQHQFCSNTSLAAAAAAPGYAVRTICPPYGLSKANQSVQFVHP